MDPKRDRDWWMRAREDRARARQEMELARQRAEIRAAQRLAEAEDHRPPARPVETRHQPPVPRPSIGTYPYFEDAGAGHVAPLSNPDARSCPSCGFFEIACICR